VLRHGCLHLVGVLGIEGEWPLPPREFLRVIGRGADLLQHEYRSEPRAGGCLL